MSNPTFLSADRPRILYLALSTARHRARAEAVLATWARDLPPGDGLAFAGDDALADALGGERAWPCVRAGSPDDVYMRLPAKMLAGFRRALAEPDWDFLFKLDDDTYAVPRRITAILDEHDPRAALFGGGAANEVTTEQFPESHAVRAARGERPFRFLDFLGGAGYFVTRAALERAWPFLEVECAAEGPEDGLVSAAMHRAGIAPTILPPFFEHERRPEYLLHGPHATAHHLTAGDMGFIHAIAPDYHDAPFEVARARTGWGAVGLAGRLGYDGGRAVVQGRPYRHAISAHAPSEVLLRGRPGERLDLRGALADSAAPGASARFSVRGRDGEPLLRDLGEARRGHPTPPAPVRFPDDGRLLLRADTPAPHGCHSVWLWTAPGQ